MLYKHFYCLFLHSKSCQFLMKARGPTWVNTLSSGSGNMIYRPIINLASRKLAWVKKLTDWEGVSTEAFFEHLLQGIREQNAKGSFQYLPLALRIPMAVICQPGFIHRLLSEIHCLGIKPRRLMLFTGFCQRFIAWVLNLDVWCCSFMKKCWITQL